MKKVRPFTPWNKILSSNLKLYNLKIIVEFKDSCLKQDNVTFTPNDVVNLFIVYELDRQIYSKRLFV